MVQTRTEPEPQVQFRVRPYGPNRTRSSVRGSEILSPEPNRTELFHHYIGLSKLHNNARKTDGPGTRTRKNPDPSFSGMGMAGYGYGSVIFTRGLPGILN